jgi:hypothetical protein
MEMGYPTGSKRTVAGDARQSATGQLFEERR